MAASGYKNPPVLEVDSDYETWKNEIEVWRLVTELEAKKQALAVTLCLKGQARVAALEIEAKELNSDNGMKTLLTALDTVFKKDEVDIAYSAYSSFDSYMRGTETMAEYIVEFERRYNLCRKHKMELPDAVLAFKILDSAALEQKERQLALTAASDLKFITMKSALKRIFGESKTTDSTAITIKPEDSAYYTGSQQNSRRGIKPQQLSKAAQKGTNPLDKFGRRTRCAICGSTYHWVKDCEHNTERSDDRKEEKTSHLTLFTKEADLVFVMESYGSAVVDTACTRTVCGRNWYDQYYSTLNAEEKLDVVEDTSQRTFRFGDGANIVSEKNVTFPATIGTTKCKINSEVVEADIPLLLSKDSLKRAGAVLNLEKDEATMFGKTVKLDFTSTGHYCIDLNGTSKANIEDSEQVLESAADKKKILIKLHRQFGHASNDKLKKLLENAGVKDASIFQILEDIFENCEVCVKFKKTPSRPKVGLPMATEFNETVAVDLHQLEGNVWLLHMIDLYSRYSGGAIVTSKAGSVFVDKFLKRWISIFGAPRKLFSDNGGEFENEEVRQMGENFGIEILTTAAYSPWSNGLCERHNLTLSEMVYKMKKDQQCSWEVALHWALMAKNSLSNVHGYSSHQIVFGINPNLPSVLTDALPAMEGTTSSLAVAEHITAMYNARKTFTESECSERIRRALRGQVTTSREETYSLGDKVYYKRPDRNEWKGPAKVIGQDGVVVFVRHGGQLVRVHVCRLKKVQSTDGGIAVQDGRNVQKQSAEQETHGTVSGPDVNREGEDSESDGEKDQEREEVGNSNASVVSQKSVLKLKPGQVISFKKPEGEKCTATVLSRAGKATGKYSNWYNIQYESTGVDERKSESIDLEQVSDLTVEPEPDLNVQQNEEVLVTNEVSFEEAKLEEMRSWKQHGVYHEVNDIGQKTISTRWICTLKEKEGNLVPKARLVARGFEELDSDIPKDSPTCGGESLRIVLSVIAQKLWRVKSMDIKTAFLQGHQLDRQVFLRPPPEANAKGKVWVLNKCVYGLNDASLNWYKRVKEVMLTLGGKMSQVDPAIFYWYNREGHLRGVLACHVDDFLWGGDAQFESEVIEQVRSHFLVGREEKDSFSYVGFEISQPSDGICLSQNKYASEMKTMIIKKTRSLQKDEPVTEQERKEMRSKVGQILWIARHTRPDVMFDAACLAGAIKDAKVKDLLEVNKVIKRVKTDQVTLKFQHLSGEKTLVLYSDASLGNLYDGGSQGGQFICIRGDNDRISPICWSSRRIRRVVRSTLAAEAIACADGIDMSMFLATILRELSGSDTAVPVVIGRTDCKSLFEALKSTKDVTERRLRIEISAMKEQMENGQVHVEWVHSSEQLANCLTKKGASSAKLMAVLEAGRLQT